MRCVSLPLPLFVCPHSLVLNLVKKYALLPLVAAIVLASCGRVPDRADLVFINGAEPEALDPPLITAQATSRVGYAVFEGLTTYDETGTARPGVAERWEISPDGKRYTFHIRANAKWSNGEPVTADDFG